MHLKIMLKKELKEEIRSWSIVLKILENWNEKIEKKVKEYGLDFYPQEFEIIDFNEMIGYEAYVGMPSRYPHWSFGKVL